MVEDIIEAIDTQYAVSDYNEMVSWLKSLKERYTWKPSDEQMKQLGWVAEQNKDNMLDKELMSLYQDLKKLSFIDTLEVKEVDLELTLKDISMIRQIMFDYNRQIRNEMSIPNDEDYCKEVLKRFKAQKGE